MNRFVPILLLTVFLLNTFMLTVIRLNFEANRAVLAELFCINKDEPITVCYGSCFLEKELAEAAESKSTNSSIQTAVVVLGFAPPMVTNPENKPTAFVSKQDPNRYQNFYSYLPITEIFQPPIS